MKIGDSIHSRCKSKRVCKYTLTEILEEMLVFSCSCSGSIIEISKEMYKRKQKSGECVICKKIGNWPEFKNGLECYKCMKKPLAVRNSAIKIDGDEKEKARFIEIMKSAIKELHAGYSIDQMKPFLLDDNYERIKANKAFYRGFEQAKKQFIKLIKDI